MLTVVTKWAEAEAMIARLLREPNMPIAIDTETTGLKVFDGTDKVIGISFAGVFALGAMSYYIPIAHPSGDRIDNVARQHLKAALQGRTLIFANVQFDMAGLYHAGIDLIDSPFFDILTMANLIDENRPFAKSLEMLSRHYLGEDEGKVKDKYVEAEKVSGNQNITADQIFDYAVTDAELAYRVWDVLSKHANWLHLQNSTDVWEHKQRLIRVFIHMRMRGITVDQAVAKQMEEVGSKRIAELREELQFNPSSHKDMEAIFIDKLNFPVLKRSKKTEKPSFDKSVMELYDIRLEKMDSPLAKQVKEYRGWVTSVGLCYRPYLKFVDPDGKIRCSFNTHRTTTGRLSSSEPNMQQVPKESDKPWSGRVKECFVPSPGYTLVSFDYSQLELRLATCYAGEESLRQIFNDPDRDLFSEMNEELGFGSRATTKTFVYEMQYGAGVNRVMMVHNVDEIEARELINRYKSLYPNMSNFAELCKLKAERQLKVSIWTGRYRHFMYKSEGYKAMNSVIQGGAADLVERVMCRVWDETECDDCHMLLQVHDALVFEIKDELVDYYSPIIKRTMEDVNAVVPKHLDISFDCNFNVEVSPWVA